jgi:hypothetical protein
MSTSGQKRKRPTGEVLDTAITAAKTTNDIGEAVHILAPLKGAMGVLINVLENAKVSQSGSDGSSQLRRHFRKLK